MLATVSLLALLVTTLDTTQGELAIRAAHQRTVDRYPRSITLVQKTTFADGRVETWYKSALLPGRLRFDIAPVATGRSMIFRGDSVYQYMAGQLRGGIPQPYRLLTLLRDLHVDDPAVTAAKLSTAGFDLQQVHASTWQQRPVLVIGALAGDSTTNQFWLDTERGVVVRLIERLPGGARLDIQVGNHSRRNDVWLERSVRVFVNGVLQQTDEYHDVRLGEPVDPGAFDPAAPRRPVWFGDGLPRWP